MKIFLMIVRMLPALIEAMRVIEAAIPERGKGPEKAATVIGIVADTVEESAVMLPAIASVITRLVDLFNSTGEFKKPEPK